MAAKTKSRAIDPWKSKKWFPVYGPKYMRSAFIGETPASEREKVMGKEIRISLAAVTGEIRKQNTQITFKITNMQGNNALADVKKIELSAAQIKRQIRKGRDRIDEVFRLKTADGKEVIMKALLVTRNKVDNSKKTLLRKLARQELKEYLGKTDYNQLVQDLVAQKLQKAMGQALRKVCPLKNSEIRVMQLAQPLEEKGISEEEQPAEEPAEEEKEEKEEEKKETTPRKKEPVKKKEKPQEESS